MIDIFIYKAGVAVKVSPMKMLQEKDSHTGSPAMCTVPNGI